MTTEDVLATGSIMCEDEISGLTENVGEADNCKSLLSIRVNRRNIVEDMMLAFKEPDIMRMDLKYSFVNEIGTDEKDVSREVYTAFWHGFFQSKADGERWMVPATTPSWQTEEWTAIGRIWTKAFLDHQILPLKFAPVFIITFIFGERFVTSDLLMDSFSGYLSSNDEAVVKGFISGNIDADDEETFVDILSAYGCHTIPDRSSAKSYILQLAHRKLIQEPKYVVDCFSPLRKYLASKVDSVATLMEMYDQVKPTSRRIIKMLKATPGSEKERITLQYFEQYLRAQPDDQLTRLLRFMTGSDIICVSSIAAVKFTRMRGAGRRPMVYCCGPVLLLPSTYVAYRELRYEFDCILANELNFRMDLL